MWNDICLIPGHYCNYRAAAAAAHMNHDGAEEGAHTHLTYTEGCLATFYGVWQARKGKARS